VIGVAKYLAMLLLSATVVTAQAGWHHPLYLGNDGYWRQRVRLDIRNNTQRDASGAPVALKVGEGANEADLAGASAEAVRVCSAAGTEMLFAIEAPDGRAVTKGPIPAGSTLTIPVECPAGESVTYYIYFDNPAAWPVPDFLEGAEALRNGGVEDGAGDTPFGWAHDDPDAQHRASWVSETPHSGKRCLKTVVAPWAEPTWISTRQYGIRIIGGARYVMRAWVKADNVQGYAGWYIHVGNDENPMIISPMLSGGGGTYDWKEVTAEFTAPPEADRADLGTVLRGTGTAWFDDVTLEAETPAQPTVRVSRPERMNLLEVGAGGAWFDDDASDDVRWDHRVPVTLLNFTDQPQENLLAQVDLAPILARLRGRASRDAVRVTDGARAISFYLAGDSLLFGGAVPARSARTYYVYLATDRRIPPAETFDYASLLASPCNLVSNPSFEDGADLPTGWPGSGEGEMPAGATLTLDRPGLFGERCVKLFVPRGGQTTWTGWRQDVSVKPGATYVYAAWVKCQDVDEGEVRIHAHYRTATGDLCRWPQYATAGPPIGGTKGWTLMVGLFTTPDDCAIFQLHLTMNTTGTVWHDGVVLAEVTPARVGALEARPAPAGAGLLVWSVNPIVKVFREDTPTLRSSPDPVGVETSLARRGRIRHARRLRGPYPALPSDATARRAGYAAGEATARRVFGPSLGLALPSMQAGGEVRPAVRLSCARNEKEPLQLAIRSAEAIRQVRIEVDPPTDAHGSRLPDPEIGIVGYVPIDYPTSYYLTKSPPWRRKYPTAPGGCDGWAGWWPDPLLPRSTFDLAADQTQPVWITVSVPKGAAPGDYAGKIRLVAGGRTLKQVPFTVHVWDFALPEENHVGAIYDLRVGGQWSVPGQSDAEVRRQLERFMAEHRVCPDTISPDPVIKYANGAVTADFTEFDKAAERYFDELKFPYTYTPWYFYCFGWGLPPGEKFGEKPYEGQYPYENVDRSRLRPAFNKAYQACLKAYWDHMKQKGWADRCVLYLSDEPFYHREPIRAQMKALCEMIHEVDPAIPIYVSTWQHCPEWDGFINLWGIGHYGIVPPEKMAELRAAGDRVRFTTDGHMCTDTPYCAIERLLPHYCFKYGVEAYEFWGITWLTYNPYEFGWHSYIPQTDTPGEVYWVRYPNGDGFLAYPGGPIGHDGPVSSIRLEQAREGVEDYEYLYLLRDLIGKAKGAGRDTTEAERALERASRLVDIPNAGGRYSTKILPNPDAVLRVREAVARAIEALEEAAAH
jgi:hypothetical protein